MPAERMRCAQHDVVIAAPAGVVYGLVADAAHWPRYFPSVVHVEQLEFDGRQARHRLWDIAEGRVRSWTTRLVFSSDLRRVDFWQEQSEQPLTSMHGSWTVEAIDDRRTRLTLSRTFTVARDDPESAAWAEHTLDTTTRLDLAGVRCHAQHWSDLDELVLSFEDSVRVDGPSELAYDMLYRIRDWPRFLPQVAHIDVREDPPGVQLVRAQTQEADHLPARTTEAVRICFPHAGRIVFKRTLPPGPLAAHTGEWSVLPDTTGVTVTAQHRAVLDPDLCPGTDTAQVRRQVRESLGRESEAALQLAKRHAESAVRVL
ncbi:MULTISPECIES: aromatase/cyclase [unclassified Streptomyces]|uniref:aromatase/cyclase n=1 Tax=unclassified Streptomyces TaxID=2593676 RepID=UPI002F916F6F